MSVMHQQAMSYVYQQVLSKLLSTFSLAQRAGVQALIQRLQAAAGGAQHLETYKVMLLMGGGKASAASMAVLRAAQLTLAARNQPTFRLRLVICSHGSLDVRRQENIQRCCNALFVHDDPRVELLQLDEDRISPYACGKSEFASGRSAWREQLLTCGHLGGNDLSARLQGEACLALARLYRRLLSWKGGVDAIAIEHLPEQRRQFVAWAMRRLHKAGYSDLARSQWQGTGCLRALEQLDPETGRGRYAAEIKDARFLTIHEVVGNLSMYSGLLAFLGCRVPEPIFHPGESRYLQIVLLAHLEGLRAEYVRESTYASGVNLALRRLQRMLKSEDAASINRLAPLEIARENARALVRGTYELTETQLTCLVFAPIVDHGARMEAFLRACHPGMLVAMPYLQKALQGSAVPDQVTQWLQESTGLPMPALQALYRMRSAP